MTEKINHPRHYQMGGIEVIDAVEAWGFGEGFNRGNAIKYIARAGRKAPETEIEDLKKARWYIDREIQRLGGQKEDEEVAESTFDAVIECLDVWAESARIGDGEQCLCLTDVVSKAVTALKCHKQVAWERNIAVEQLRSIGKELGADMDDVQALLGQFDSECESCKIPGEE